MEEQVLSIKQMQELKELGIDTSKASAFYYPNYGDYYKHPITKKYVRDIKSYNPYPSFVNGARTLKDLNPDLFPTFTLQDILDKIFKFTLSKVTRDVYVCHTYVNGLVEHRTNGKTALEASFNMLKWCKQNNYI